MDTKDAWGIMSISSDNPGRSRRPCKVVRNGTPQPRQAMEDTTSHQFHRRGLSHNRIALGSTQSKRARPNRDERALRARIACRAQCHLIAALDQRIGKPSNDSLRSAIKAGWDAFCERSNLRDAHQVGSAITVGQVRLAWLMHLCERLILIIALPRGVVSKKNHLMNGWFPAARLRTDPMTAVVPS
jgi:hypothetical protein